MRASEITTLTDKGFENKGQTRNEKPKDLLFRYIHQKLNEFRFDCVQLQNIKKMLKSIIFDLIQFLNSLYFIGRTKVDVIT
jgi:hypothetical protein